jgi:hypothetical protein
MERLYGRLNQRPGAPQQSLSASMFPKLPRQPRLPCKLHFGQSPPMVGAPDELTHGAIETPVFTISTSSCFYGVRYDLVPPVPYGTKVKESQDLEQTGPRLRLRMSRVERSEDPADDGDQATAPSLTFAATFLDCIRPKQPKFSCAVQGYSSGSRLLRASVG